MLWARRLLAIGALVFAGAPICPAAEAVPAAYFVRISYAGKQIYVTFRCEKPGPVLGEITSTIEVQRITKESQGHQRLQPLDAAATADLLRSVGDVFVVPMPRGQEVRPPAQGDPVVGKVAQDGIYVTLTRQLDGLSKEIRQDIRAPSPVRDFVVSFLDAATKHIESPIMTETLDDLRRSLKPPGRGGEQPQSAGKSGRI